MDMAACLQGMTHARVTFKAEDTGEDTFYELKLTSGAPEPLGQLVLECPVRSQTSTSISVSNPLTVPSCCEAKHLQQTGKPVQDLLVCLQVLALTVGLAVAVSDAYRKTLCASMSEVELNIPL